MVRQNGIDGYLGYTSKMPGCEAGESDLACPAGEEHRPCLVMLTGYSARVMAAPVVDL